MIKSIKMRFCMAALALGGVAGMAQGAVTRNLVCQACGTWNDQGVHNSHSNYQIGHSTQLPHMQAAYYVFDLTPIKGKKVTNLNCTIPGSTDYTITDVWQGHTPTHQFRVTMRDQGPNSVNDIVNGNNNKALWINATDENRNGEMGYAWVKDGVHQGLAFDCWHFQLPTSADFDGYTFQPAVDRGGLHVLWACDGFESGVPRGAENYVWGNTAFNHGIVLHVTTTN